MFFRRRRIPLWVWVLALVGLRSLWGGRIEVETNTKEWRRKRRRFGEKLREAFRVWQEPDESPDSAQDAESSNE